jgi:hypothetical protein
MLGIAGWRSAAALAVVCSAAMSELGMLRRPLTKTRTEAQMLCAVLCYDDEKVVNAWASAEDDAGFGWRGW